MSATLHSENYPGTVELFLNISFRHGSQIRKLTLGEVEFKRFKDFSDVLTYMPLLEDLEMFKLKFALPGENKKLNNMKPVALKYLKSLKVAACSWIVFQYLIGSQITTLTLTSTVIRPEVKCLLNFLEASTKLETLEIDNKAFNYIFQQENLPVRLKRFKSLAFTYSLEVDPTNDNFKVFLESQAFCLEELELNYVTRDVLKTIVNKLKKLRHLRINANSLPSDKEFYDQINPMKSLKEIEVHDEVDDDVALTGLLGNCPNLELLKALYGTNDVSSRNIPFMMVNNEKIKYLHIDALKTEIGAEIKLPSLQFLHVESGSNIKYLLAFIANNTSITTLSLGAIDKETSMNDFLDTLMNSTGIKHLKLSGDFDTMQAVYDKIKVDYKNLKTLALKIERVKPVLSFVFPEEKSRWDSRCPFFDN